jgi:hypothetical protein
MQTVKLAVVGAHLKDMPLHWQLTSRNATFVEATQTAPTYRLYAIANSVPPKPALIHAEDGAAIAVEVYEMGVAEFGSFTVEVPAPLAIGTVTLADGTSVKGFVAEPRAIEGARDITDLGAGARSSPKTPEDPPSPPLFQETRHGPQPVDFGGSGRACPTPHSRGQSCPRRGPGPAGDCGAGLCRLPRG